MSMSSVEVIMARLLVSIVAILGVVACEGAMNRPSSEVVPVENGVVFQHWKSSDLNGGYESEEFPDPHWIPDRQVVNEAAGKLPNFLTRSGYGRLVPRLGEYRFQYFGFSGQGSGGNILLNAFCKAHWKDAPEWRSRPVYVLDGGDCFFQAIYSTEDGEFQSIAVNGES